MSVSVGKIHAVVRELIDTLWNVNASSIVFACRIRNELIDTLWNVN